MVSKPHSMFKLEEVNYIKLLLEVVSKRSVDRIDSIIQLYQTASRGGVKTYTARVSLESILYQTASRGGVKTVLNRFDTTSRMPQ